MTYTVSSGERIPYGNFHQVNVRVEDVTQTGDYVSASGLYHLQEVRNAVGSAIESATAVQIRPNVRNGTDPLGTNPGDVFLTVVSGGPSDVFLQVTGR